MLSQSNISRGISRLAGVAIAALAISCSGEAQKADQVVERQEARSEQADPMQGPAGEYTSQDSLPRIRYAVDDQVSLNDRCPVRLVRLNLRLDPLYVNGLPIGFC